MFIYSTLYSTLYIDRYSTNLPAKRATLNDQPLQLYSPERKLHFQYTQHNMILYAYRHTGAKVRTSEFRG